MHLIRVPAVTKVHSAQSPACFTSDRWPAAINIPPSSAYMKGGVLKRGAHSWLRSGTSKPRTIDQRYRSEVLTQPQVFFVHQTTLFILSYTSCLLCRNWRENTKRCASRVHPGYCPNNQKTRPFILTCIPSVLYFGPKERKPSTAHQNPSGIRFLSPRYVLFW